MVATICQVMGFLLSLLGVAGIIAATGMDQWSTQDLFDNPVTAVFSYSGLWNSCVRQSSGFTECRPYFTILGLPALLQAVRALMVVGIILGAIGSLIAIFSMKCLKMGSMDDNIKATMTLTAGIMNVLAGICAIAGVSAFANLVVQSFRFASYAGSGLSMGGMSGGGIGGLSGSLTPRYTFGPALFVGWIGGAVLFIGGIMMCLACRGMAQDGKQRNDGMTYKAASHQTMYKTDPRSHPAQSYRAQSVDGNQKFDYV
ncbi:claudin-18-like isoform X1 [Pseudoliparis swirei]|uniref:claudin-18-like isoform X1 n=1 Tax=Pseudoliparis swirei TaxID=2059687 RepID=UPI0024BE05D5|nr:claudin-18-like isoform X1 [Pseudoliparis swirei]